MRKLLIAAIALLVLSACDGRTPEQKAADEYAGQHEVSLVAVAPDGTKLWKWGSLSPVYFASTGTATVVSSGKTSHTVHVPTAGGR